MSSIEAPNYTQMPNVMFDHWMQRLKPAEFIVLMALSRKIFGWHKTSDTISKNQIMKVTGLSKNTIQTAIEGLEAQGLIIKKQHYDEYGNRPNSYFLNLSKPIDDLYSDGQNLSPDGSSPDQGVDQAQTERVGQRLTPQKKDLTKERLTKEISAGKADASSSSLPSSSNEESEVQEDHASHDESDKVTRQHNIYYRPKSNKKQTKSSKSNQKEKQSSYHNEVSRRPNLSTTEVFHSQMLEKFGAEFTEQVYDYLSDWMKDKTEKELAKASAQGRITKWVITAVREQNLKERELKQREDRLNKASVTQPSSNKEKVLKRFKHGTSYCGYECSISDTGIGFYNFQGYGDQLKFTEYGFDDQLNNILRKRKIDETKPDR